MSVSRWERGVQEPSSQMFVKLGAMSEGDMRWLFWEHAGLHRAQVEAESGNVLIVDDPTGLRHRAHHSALVPIPLLDARLGASVFGDLLAGYEVVEILAAPAEWCPNPRHTIAAFAEGDSMEPCIREGSIVCVDTSEKSPAKLTGEIVVAQHPLHGTRLARLDAHGGGWVLCAENPKVEPTPFDADWKLIGHVLWWLTRTGMERRCH